MGNFPKPLKHFGQHFLHSKVVINKIHTSCTEEIDAIIEVGPGPGVLTSGLLRVNKNLFLFEADPRFSEKLLSIVPKDNLTIGDALETDWQNFFEKHQLKKVWLVSNLPYNVSVPLTMNFFKAPQIKYMTLMYQKEVAEKFYQSKSKNNMNSLFFLGTNFFAIKKISDVPPGAFSPPPKVDSQVLYFERNITPAIELSDFDKIEAFLRHLFSQKRKQIRNILGQYYNHKPWDTGLKDLAISPQSRAESLNFEEILSLWKYLTKKVD